MISIIITTYNEGAEVQQTIDSIRQNTSDYEIVVVDDASTDGSCDTLQVDRLIRHSERIGIAYSRTEGVMHAKGDVYAFLDGHQRLSEGCFNKCAELALERQCIVYPCVRGLEDRGWVGHGARMVQQVDRKVGLFGGEWNKTNPGVEISRCTTMIVPGYVFPASIYHKIGWINGLRNWGASEPAITVKAFFCDIDILHLCGPLARHMFRPGRRIPYETPWSTVWRNHALIARVCFDDQTWRNYWIPHVFAHWLKGALDEFDREEVLRQHDAFQAIKQRPDDEFWRGVIKGERQCRH